MTEIRMDPKTTTLRQLQFALEELPQGIAQHVQGDGIAAAARVVAKEAKAYVPVDTGMLRGAIAAKRKTVRYRVAGINITGGKSFVTTSGFRRNNNVYWGQFVEKGTAHSDANPFVVPAQESTEPQQLAAFIKGNVRGWNNYQKRLKAGRLTKAQTKLYDLGF